MISRKVYLAAELFRTRLFRSWRSSCRILLAVVVVALFVGVLGVQNGWFERKDAAVSASGEEDDTDDVKKSDDTSDKDDEKNGDNQNPENDPDEQKDDENNEDERLEYLHLVL